MCVREREREDQNHNFSIKVKVYKPMQQGEINLIKHEKDNIAGVVFINAELTVLCQLRCWMSNLSSLMS